ncbi:MAG: hypothetical protein C5B43_02080 [Verrucomicrobia bacterium]|nr:MAG: hypothetical protein C5B43_02080 [Verrucomicrobiota bacterium]
MNSINSIKTFSDKIDYELLRIIGKGGMSTIYEAHQKGSNDFEKTVAIKFILEKYSNIPEFRSNFLGEAKLVADLIHTNIVQTYHLGQKDSQYYMVMEYVQGINLEDFLIFHLENKKTIPIPIAVYIIAEVCRGLSYAHQKRSKEGVLLNIVHRDVNPRNIMLSYEGDVKITDFGIAKARDLMYNKEGQRIAGKDEYLSPEQALKKVTDPRADIFSCGIILSELILGYNIFEESKPTQTRKNIIECTIPNFKKLHKDIDLKLNRILGKTLKKDPKDRYQSAFDLFNDLEKYLYGNNYGPNNEKLAQYLIKLFNIKELAITHHCQKTLKNNSNKK